jgi:hypothetical protein
MKQEVTTHMIMCKVDAGSEDFCTDCKSQLTFADDCGLYHDCYDYEDCEIYADAVDEETS